MSLTTYPIKIQIYDEDLPVATVETQDEASARVNVTGWVNAESWPELAEAIRLALVSMKLEE